VVTKAVRTDETPQPTQWLPSSQIAQNRVSEGAASRATPRPKLNIPVTSACYTVLRCVQQVLLLIWEGQLPHGNQAHHGLNAWK